MNPGWAVKRQYSHVCVGQTKSNQPGGRCADCSNYRLVAVVVATVDCNFGSSSSTSASSTPLGRARKAPL